MAQDHEFERALELSRNALDFLHKSSKPPTPNNYEVFYTYASGANKNLNQAINNLLETNNGVSQSEASAFYDTFVGSGRLNTKVDQVGATMSSEITEVINTLNSATDSTSSFNNSLDLVNKQLGRITDPAQFKIVVQSIVAATQKMANNTKQLEDRLSASKQQITELHLDLETVRTESFTDDLTGVPNRKRFDNVLENAISEAEDTGEPLCLLMMDIDHFKAFNDNHGHLAGDGVLRLVAKTMQSNIKGRDLVARYGGEEFSVILPFTQLKDALVLAEQIRKAVKTKELVKKSSGISLGHVTLSIGAALHRKGEAPKDIIERADTCLYAAKHAGRDQVKSETETAEPAANVA